MECRKEQLSPGEHTRFWRADDLGDVELLHTRYRTHSFGRHTHQGLAIGVISGGVESFSCKGDGYNAVSGQIIVFNPDEAHTGEAADDDGWAFRMFYIDAELFRSAALGGDDDRVEIPAFRSPILDDPELAQTLCRLHKTLESSDSSLERQEVFLLTLRALTRRHAGVRLKDKQVGSERRAVRLVREYLDANTRRNVTLDELSRLSGLSPHHLIRVFSAERGLSPHAYFEQVRIHRARNLLLRGIPIADVAARLGFTDQSHLNRHFKKLTGITPGVYRNAISSKTSVPLSV